MDADDEDDYNEDVHNCDDNFDDNDDTEGVGVDY